MTDNLLSMVPIQEFMQAVSREIDAVLDELVPAADLSPVRLHEAIRWSLFGGAKRVRPAILFGAGKTFGADNPSLVRTAAAIEMIHTFSLIHDDLPAMDDDDLRRGRATCHKKYGEATAILAGDALQVMAFKVIAEDEHLSPDLRLRLVADIAAASGTPCGMVAGQQLDLEAEHRTVSLDEIENIHMRKTGALISASANAGALIGGATGSELTAVAAYASRLGLLFQITDDLLDVTGETETLGKTAGKDVMAEKATYPGHFGIDETRKMAEAVRIEARAALDSVKRDTDTLKALADLIASRTN